MQEPQVGENAPYRCDTEEDVRAWIDREREKSEEERTRLINDLENALRDAYPLSKYPN